MPSRHTAYRDRLRANLPYGLWRLENGREILFNRAYQPIWERAPEAPPKPADRNEWVQGASCAQVIFFYDDACVPYRDSNTRKSCEEVLRQFQNGEQVTARK